jgi:hypothetical protein
LIGNTNRFVALRWTQEKQKDCAHWRTCAVLQTAFVDIMANRFGCKREM